MSTRVLWLGLATGGLFCRNRRDQVVVLVVAVVARAHAYHGQYFKMQAVNGQGGGGNLAFVLPDMLPEDSLTMALGQPNGEAFWHCFRHRPTSVWVETD